MAEVRRMFGEIVETPEELQRRVTEHHQRRAERGRLGNPQLPPIPRSHSRPSSRNNRGLGGTSPPATGDESRPSSAGGRHPEKLRHEVARARSIKEAREEALRGVAAEKEKEFRAFEDEKRRMFEELAMLDAEMAELEDGGSMRPPHSSGLAG